MNTELRWIGSPWPGRVAISPRPRGGDWLEDEVESWYRSGIGMVVSLLDGDEITELQLGDEPQLCEARGIQFWWFPIADRGIPPSRQNVLELVEALAAELATGKDLLVHCRQGIGRAGLLAACLLVYSGLDPGEAIKRLSELRGCTIPETAEQQRWILDFAQSLFTKLAK